MHWIQSSVGGSCGGWWFKEDKSIPLCFFFLKSPTDIVVGDYEFLHPAIGYRE
jgi:hypothetical protein